MIILVLPVFFDQGFQLGPAQLDIELNLSLISTKSLPKYEKFSKFPSVRRDISVLIDKDISLSEVQKCIREVADKIWLVSFMEYDLGFFDQDEGRVEPTANPFIPVPEKL